MKDGHDDLSIKTTRAYELFRNQLDKIRPANVKDDVSVIIEQIKILEQYSYNKSKYYILFSLIDFLPVYVSANITQLGYTQRAISRLTTYDIFKAFYREQLSLGSKIIRWNNNFRKIVPDFGNQGDELIFFGIKLTCKLKESKTFSFKCRWIGNNSSSSCGYAFIEAEDIGNLYKSDIWWGKYNAKRRNLNITRYFFSSGTKKESADLFSQREWEILQLILKHKDSAEISQLLNITVETVRKHRKNMIARVGVRDTTALVQLLKLGGIIS